MIAGGGVSLCGPYSNCSLRGSKLRSLRSLFQSDSENWPHAQSAKVKPPESLSLSTEIGSRWQSGTLLRGWPERALVPEDDLLFRQSRNLECMWEIIVSDWAGNEVIKNKENTENVPVSSMRTLFSVGLLWVSMTNFPLQTTFECHMPTAGSSQSRKHA